VNPPPPPHDSMAAIEADYRLWIEECTRQGREIAQEEARRFHEETERKRRRLEDDQDETLVEVRRTRRIRNTADENAADAIKADAEEWARTGANKAFDNNYHYFEKEADVRREEYDNAIDGYRARIGSADPSNMTMRDQIHQRNLDRHEERVGSQGGPPEGGYVGGGDIGAYAAQRRAHDTYGGALAEGGANVHFQRIIMSYEEPLPEGERVKRPEIPSWETYYRQPFVEKVPGREALGINDTVLVRSEFPPYEEKEVPRSMVGDGPVVFHPTDPPHYGEYVLARKRADAWVNTPDGDAAEAKAYELSNAWTAFHQTLVDAEAAAAAAAPRSDTHRNVRVDLTHRLGPDDLAGIYELLRANAFITSSDHTIRGNTAHLFGQDAVSASRLYALQPKWPLTISGGIRTGPQRTAVFTVE
jgi:hypothetical protein